MFFEHCWDEFKEEERTQERQRRRRVEVQSRICREYPWWDPRGWVCWIEVIVRYIWERFWETFLALIKVTTCVLCEIGFILTGHRIIAYKSEGRPSEEEDVPSRHNYHASAFNNAAVTSRFHYTDSGKKYSFEIGSDGVVYHVGPDTNGLSVTLKHNPDDYQKGPLKENIGPLAISYTEQRTMKIITPMPEFDMIAASCGRIFVKEKDKANFYFTTMEHEFLHADALDPIDPIGNNYAVPGFYFKLDPQHNQDDAGDLKWWNRDDYNHPSLDAYKFVPLGKKGLEVGLAVGLAVGVLVGLVAGPPVGLTIGLLAGFAAAFIAGSLQDYMMVMVHPRVWHLLDTRPPFDSGAPPRWVETYNHVTYGGRYLGICEKRHQKSLKIHEVLDIAVGHMHRHLHYEDIYGGEMDTMVTGIYDIFNGPVDDKGGFCDGTCNFYALCKIKIDADGDGVHEKETYGILWMDEQSYFSERWRLLHPDDHKWAPLRDWSIVKHLFQRDESFWCPFEDSWFNSIDRIDGTSRMAVARQTVLVTGKDPDEGYVLYSINFSWGTSDRTWRWRRYPKGCKVEHGTDIKQPQEGVSYCLPNTIAIREDMTIYMRGVLAKDSGHENGFWYQKYLPADNREVPNEDEFDEEDTFDDNGKPQKAYPQEWQFINEENFRRADSFSHFGVYENVDSRSQYYHVDLSPNSEFPDYPSFIPWVDRNNSLYVLTGQLLRFPPFHHCPPSMFNDRTYLKIVRREPFGLIAMHWDKRDDELPGFSNILRKVTLSSQAYIVLRDSSNYPTKNIEVTLSKQKKNWTPPVVQMVKLIVDKTEEKIVIIFYSRVANPSSDLPDEEEYAPGVNVSDASQLNYSPPEEFKDFSDYLSDRYLNCTDSVFPGPHPPTDPDFSPDTSIRRVKVGALDDTYPNNVCIVFNEVISGRFSRKSRYLYYIEWHRDEDAAWAEDFDRAVNYCDENGCVEHGTSVWFEDLTGHVNTAEKTIFKSV